MAFDRSRRTARSAPAGCSSTPPGGSRRSRGLPDGHEGRPGLANVWATGPGWRPGLRPPTAPTWGRLNTGEATANVGWGDDGSSLYITADMYLGRLKTTARGIPASDAPEPIDRLALHESPPMTSTLVPPQCRWPRSPSILVSCGASVEPSTSADPPVDDGWVVLLQRARSATSASPALDLRPLNEDGRRPGRASSGSRRTATASSWATAPPSRFWAIGSGVFALSPPRRDPPPTSGSSPGSA